MVAWAWARAYQVWTESGRRSSTWFSTSSAFWASPCKEIRVPDADEGLRHTRTDLERTLELCLRLLRESAVGEGKGVSRDSLGQIDCARTQ